MLCNDIYLDSPHGYRGPKLIYNVISRVVTKIWYHNRIYVLDGLQVVCDTVEKNTLESIPT